MAKNHHIVNSYLVKEEEIIDRFENIVRKIIEMRGLSSERLKCLLLVLIYY